VVICSGCGWISRLLSENEDIGPEYAASKGRKGISNTEKTEFSQRIAKEFNEVLKN
jgi:hypothetical protein